jgi:hypothetical protein
VATVLAVVWYRRSGARRLEDRRRREAQELRQRAEVERIEVQEREAEAARIDAQARMAKAEADARAAEAARLEVEARDRAEELNEPRAAVHDRLRRADRIDPDVRDEGSPAPR